MTYDHEPVPPTAPDAPLLRFDGITKRYGTHRALSDVTLSVEAGEFVVLLGPSGSGKSTLLRCAAGVERISEGAIHLAGEVVDDGRRQVPPERRDLAMVFQDYALWPQMTARQNVRFALRRRRLPSPEADRRAREMLATVGLSALTERYPSELSGGEQQRVALARALVARTRLLLFDEPLSNLDASLRDRMRIEIATLVREVGTTALYITHDQAEAFALADRIGVLEGGGLIQFGRPETIYAAPATPFVARLTGLSGELVGRVEGPRPDSLMNVAISDATIAARGPASLVPGATVRVLVRPAAVRLLASTNDAIQMRAEVRDVAFCGRGYEHVVRLPCGASLTGIFAETRWDRGAHVGVRFDPDGCLLFPASDREALQSTVVAPPEPARIGNAAPA